MNKKIFALPIVLLLLVGTVMAVRDSIRISTQRYVEDTIYVDNTPIEGNVIVDIMVRERCSEYCSFRPYLFGTNRIRFYGLYDGKLFAFEIKKIVPSEVTFEEDYFGLEGTATVFIEYLERKYRNIYYDVPIELNYDKESEELTIEIFDSVISGIDVGYR